MRASPPASRPRDVTLALRKSNWPPSLHLCLAGVAVVVTFGLTLDTLLHPLAPFDRVVLRSIQAIDLPLLAPTMHVVDTVTDSTWAPIIWTLVLALLLIGRWWSAAVVTLLMPLGGVINHLIGVLLVNRSRPGEEDALRTIGSSDAPSFPSGHVMGAVMLYGLLLCLVPRIEPRLVRVGVSILSIGIVGLVGVGRIWLGAHWPSDVLAAYSVGGLWVIGQQRAMQLLDSAGQHWLDHREEDRRSLHGQCRPPADRW